MENKAQIATEYLLVVAFALIIAIPLAFLFSKYMIETQDQVAGTQADRIIKQVIDNAEQVYFIGSPSKTTIKVYMPKNVEQINIGSEEMVIVLDTKSGLSEITGSTQVNLTGSIPATPGIKSILIESKGDYVEITGS